VEWKGDFMKKQLAGLVAFAAMIFLVGIAGAQSRGSTELSLPADGDGVSQTIMAHFDSEYTAYSRNPIEIGPGEGVVPGMSYRVRTYRDRPIAVTLNARCRDRSNGTQMYVQLYVNGEPHDSPPTLFCRGHHESIAIWSFWVVLAPTRLPLLELRYVNEQIPDYPPQPDPGFFSIVESAFTVQYERRGR